MKKELLKLRMICFPNWFRGNRVTNKEMLGNSTDYSVSNLGKSGQIHLVGSG